MSAERSSTTPPADSVATNRWNGRNTRANKGRAVVLTGQDYWSSGGRRARSASRVARPPGSHGPGAIRGSTRSGSFLSTGRVALLRAARPTKAPATKRPAAARNASLYIPTVIIHGGNWSNRRPCAIAIPAAVPTSAPRMRRALEKLPNRMSGGDARSVPTTIGRRCVRPGCSRSPAVSRSIAPGANGVGNTSSR